MKTHVICSIEISPVELPDYLDDKFKKRLIERLDLVNESQLHFYLSDGFICVDSMKSMDGV